jgi:hypothetical protein
MHNSGSVTLEDYPSSGVEEPQGSGWAQRCRAWESRLAMSRGLDLEGLSVRDMRTEKGRGVPAVEDQTGKHGKPLDDSEAAISELSSAR